MEIVVEYYSPRNEWVKYKNGFGSYYNTDSILRDTKTFDWNTQDEKDGIFAWFYNKNNELRYCNGSYWKFADPMIEHEYRTVFFPKFNTIEHYYRGGVVD